eukprot:352665-Chlamydomonas_euryale.AAC.2
MVEQMRMWGRERIRKLTAWHGWLGGDAVGEGGGEAGAPCASDGLACASWQHKGEGDADGSVRTWPLWPTQMLKIPRC